MVTEADLALGLLDLLARDTEVSSAFDTLESRDRTSGQLALAAFAGALLLAAVFTTLSRGIRQMSPLEELHRP